MTITEETKKLAGSIVAIAVVIGLCFGVYFHFQKTFAPMAIAEELKQFKQDYQYDRLDNIREKTQQRIWTIKERFGEKPQDEGQKKNLNELEYKMKQLDEQIKKLEKK